MGMISEAVGAIGATCGSIAETLDIISAFAPTIPLVMSRR